MNRTTKILMLLIILFNIVLSVHNDNVSATCGYATALIWYFLWWRTNEQLGCARRINESLHYFIRSLVKELNDKKEEE